ncbi:SDR family NAD(P)-dependent oxidoreductase [Candidatus Nomurabacteria bacterium]|nr:SDR family NAD(P)-dependent oxidoreductase [Candidatus Nomurabacteria bacterium]
MITGASSGLGREFAYLCAAAGHNLMLIARSGERLIQIGSEIETSYKVTVINIVADLGCVESIQKIQHKLSSENIFVNILINAAGAGKIEKFCDSDPDVNRYFLNLNIASIVYLNRLVLQEMINRNEGRILNVSSTAAFIPGPWFSLYHASKSFIFQFSRSLSYELKNSDVKVTVFCPGQMNTKFQAAAGMSRRMQSKKLVSPENVAVYGFKAMLKGKPVSIYGLCNQIKYYFIMLIPDKILLFLAAKNNISKINT